MITYIVEFMQTTIFKYFVTLFQLTYGITLLLILFNFHQKEVQVQIR
jgi:hypothetical protein